MEKITERQKNIAEWKAKRILRYIEKYIFQNGKIRSTKKLTIAEEFSQMNRDKLYM